MRRGLATMPRKRPEPVLFHSLFSGAAIQENRNPAIALSRDAHLLRVVCSRYTRRTQIPNMCIHRQAACCQDFLQLFTTSILLHACSPDADIPRNARQFGTLTDDNNVHE